MKSAKPVHLFELFSIIIVALLALVSCSNAAGSSGSGPSASDEFENDSVVVEWEPFVAKYEATASGKPAYAEDRASDGSGDYSIDYQWQLALSADADSGSWEDKQSASSGEDFFYEPSASDIGKFLRVKIGWKFEGKDQSPIFSKAVKIENSLDLSGLSYNDYVKEGSCVDQSKVTGTIKDLSGQTVSGCSIKALEPDEAMFFSDYALFEVSCESQSHPTELAAIFVPVQGVLSLDDVPPLSANFESISKGKVKFSAAASRLEYSLDGSDYAALDTVEINKGTGDFEDGDIIFVRKKAAGVKYDAQGAEYIDTADIGYRMESEPVKVVVQTNNVGVATSVGVDIIKAISNIEIDLLKSEISASGSSGMVAVTAMLSNDEAIQELFDAVKVYRWFVDDSEIITNDPTADMYWAGDGQTLILNKDKLEADTYQVECRVSFKADPEDSEEEEFSLVGKQISVTVTK